MKERQGTTIRTYYESIRLRGVGGPWAWWTLDRVWHARIYGKKRAEKIARNFAKKNPSDRVYEVTITRTVKRIS